MTGKNAGNLFVYVIQAKIYRADELHEQIWR